MLIEVIEHKMKNTLREAFNYLFEQENDEQQNSNKPTSKQKLSSLFKKSYPEFVPLLGALTMDSDFMASLEGDGDGEDKLIVTTKSIRCGDLLPMQNEIGARESLDLPLSSNLPRDNIIKICSTKECGPSVYDFKGRFIITSGGKYIVDGHHRWSSLFALNPDCIIQVKDIGQYKKGVDALKISQIIIAVLLKAKGKLKSKKAKGLNILNASREELQQHIEKIITDDFIHNYIEANIDEDGESLGKNFENKEQVINKILNNCLQLQKQGIEQNSSQNDREIMPQFDDNGNYLSQASNGEVNLSDVKIAMSEHKKQLSRWKRLAGLL